MANISFDSSAGCSECPAAPPLPLVSLLQTLAWAGGLPNLYSAGHIRSLSSRAPFALGLAESESAGTVWGCLSLGLQGALATA